MSRTVTAHMFYSLNGIAGSPEIWQDDLFGPDEAEAMGRMTSATTDLVMGRRLWQEWSEYWPGADDPFGKWVNPVRKHVLSTTLTGDLGWNSVIATGGAADYLARLREEDGGDIAIGGGVETIRRLVLEGLIDELTLTIHPVIAAEGAPLFAASVPSTRLRLLTATQTSVGNIIATYAVRPETPAS